MDGEGVGEIAIPGSGGLRNVNFKSRVNVSLHHQKIATHLQPTKGTLYVTFVISVIKIEGIYRRGVMTF